MNPRSYLFVPGDRPERFDKALASGADAVVLDLEDAVAPARKVQAREAVAARLPGLEAAAHPALVVRINDSATPWFADDLSMLAAAGAAWAMLPKTESPDQVATLLAAMPRLRVLALVESARGVAAAAAIAAAPGVARLVFGTLDFALELDIAPDPEGLAHAAGALVIASRAAGLPAPVAGVTPEIDDPAHLAADFAWARRLGFAAKLAIHPKQVAPIHDLLQPLAAELTWAERVLAATVAAAGAAVQVDGRMVDRPVIERARALLARAGR